MQLLPIANNYWLALNIGWLIPNIDWLAGSQANFFPKTFLGFHVAILWLYLL